ncbi:MAG: hypothetical protein KJ729_00370 [Euryarchaeota archaeon]|nr:hypothetical protein [Euryarchaeota archaeon]
MTAHPCANKQARPFQIHRRARYRLSGQTANTARRPVCEKTTESTEDTEKNYTSLCSVE